MNWMSTLRGEHGNVKVVWDRAAVSAGMRRWAGSSGFRGIDEKKTVGLVRKSTVDKQMGDRYPWLCTLSRGQEGCTCLPTGRAAGWL